ncbi:MAG: 30S ribosome-binding factor RbfA [Bdellovibrionales bacterium]|nr:30S ribosome-binding factor RbfA [Bdellovibrionales bacterium]
MEGNNRRILRVEKELRQIVANYLISGLKEPLTGLASVTRVQISPDLRYGKVFVSIVGADDQREEDWAILNEQLGEIQRYVGRQFKTKYTPKVQLILDTSAEYADKIERLLDEVKRNPHTPPADDDDQQ